MCQSRTYLLTTGAVDPPCRQCASPVMLTWGVAPSPFGLCVAAHSGLGLTHLLFVEDAVQAEALVRHDWPQARLGRDDEQAGNWIADAFSRDRHSEAVSLHVRGTHFQLRVWLALLQIPAGGVVSYGALAASIDSPRAARAVGSAVGANPVAWLIPCHRVILGSGELGHYRGGAARKRALLAWEAAREE